MTLKGCPKAKTLKQLIDEIHWINEEDTKEEIIYQVKEWLTQKRQEYPDKYPAKTKEQQIWVLAVVDFCNELLEELKDE